MRKQTIKIVIAGHVDHGKSTLIGRLLLDTNSLSKDKFLELKKISKELGKDTELAYLIDQLKEEREQNKTIDTAQAFLKTRNKNFVIIDTPGHLEFLKNMITGSTQAEAAILLIDITEGLMEQTKRHLYILNMLGIDKIMVLLNKMDLLNYDKKTFEDAKTKLLKFTTSIGINPLFIMPVSAKEGANIAKIHRDMTWYKGPALLKALSSIKIKPRDKRKPLRFPVQDIYEINNKTVLAGRIESGALKKGQHIFILPSRNKARISSIEIFNRQNVIKAQTGENIGLVLDKKLAIKRGNILVDEKNLPELAARFEASILWLSPAPLEINKPITLRCSTRETECMIEKIHKRIDSSSLSTIEENAKELRLNETGLMTFVTKEPAFIEKFSFIPELGRFVIEKDSIPMGIGIVI